MPQQTPLPALMYVIRHAEPEPRDDLPYAIAPGPSLSACGRAQAGALGAFIARRHDGTRELACVVASPFARTHETAAIVASACALPVELADALVEQAPDETTASVRARVSTWWRAASACASGLLVVGHGASTNALLSLIGEQLDLSTTDAFSNCTPHAGLWRLQLTAEAGYRGELLWVPDGTSAPFRERVARAGRGLTQPCG